MHDRMLLSGPPLASLDGLRMQIRLLEDDVVVSFTVAENPLLREIVMVELAWDAWAAFTLAGEVLRPKSG